MPPTRAEYAKINIACNDLGIDKYHLLGDRYGKESTKDLNRQQVADLLNHFKALGWMAKRGNKQKKTSRNYESSQRRKVVALWIELHEAGVVQKRDDLALQKYVKRMTGVDNLRWCTSRQINIVIESLKKWAQREDVDVSY